MQVIPRVSLPSIPRVRGSLFHCVVEKVIPWEWGCHIFCCSCLITTKVLHETPYYESVLINMQYPSRNPLHVVNHVIWHFQWLSSNFAKVLVSTTLKATYITWDPQHVHGVWQSYRPYIEYFAFSGLQDCVFLGAGGPSLTEYQSVIFYHNSSPKWNETIKVQFFADCHFPCVLTSACKKYSWTSYEWCTYFLLAEF